MVEIKEKSKIGILLLGYLGDVINTSGIINCIKESRPDVSISMITLNSSVPAAKGIKGIDNIYTADKSVRKSVFNTIKFALTLRKKFDIIVVLDNSLRSAYLAYFTGAKYRIGRGGELRELFLTDVVPYLDEEKKMEIPVIEHYARCFKPLNLYKENIGTSFCYSDEDNNAVTDLLKNSGLYNQKFIGICPACHKKAKSMEYGDLVNLIKELNKQNEYKVVIVGGKDIIPLTDELKKDNTIIYYDFAGKTTFPQTAALIDKCKKFISIDTSCMHLAIARNVPTLALFYSNVYKKWGPKNLSNNALYVNESSNYTDIDTIMNKFNSLSDKKEVM